MRSTTLFGSILIAASSLCLGSTLSTPALAQPKGDAKKTDSSSSTDAKKDDAKKDDTKKDASGTGAAGTDDKVQDDMKKSGTTSAASSVDPPAEKWDIYDVDEVPNRSYFFVGLRYRGNVIPAFMLHLFVEEGGTIYTNMIGAEFDLRKDGFSLIPALSYHELGTQDLLFKQKNTKDIPGNYSLVNSGMKIVYASVDLLWSTKLSKNVEFEYGAGFGIGAVFGDLENSWVREDAANGTLTGANGKKYGRCNAVTVPANGDGCNRADHQNSDVDKVNGYKETSWFDGGSKPVVFPWIAVPQLGLRFKPVKMMTARLGLGFALTGFWFGLSADYGLEKKRE